MGWGPDAIKRFREYLDRTLFPAAPRKTSGLGRWEAGVILISLVALGAILQLFRLGPSTALNSLWAEDGRVFLYGAINHGFFDAVSTPYAEYLVVMPRLIGEVGAIVPLHDAALAMNLTTVIIIALSGLAIWFASAGLIHSPYLRALLVALMVLCPVSSIETVGSPTSVAWYTSFAVFWLLLWRPRSTWSAGLGGLLILATGLSTPATLFFIPIAALRAIAIRGRRDALIVGSFALAAAIQVPAMLFNDEQVTNSLWTGSIVTAFLQRAVDGSILGLKLSGSTWVDWGWPFLIAIVAALLIYLAVMSLRSSSGRLFAAIAVATSVVMFLASAYTRAIGDVISWHGGVYNNYGDRYAMVPALLLVSAVLVLLDTHYRSSRSRSSRGRPPILALGIAAVLLLSLITSFDIRGAIGRGGPPWDESLRTATAKCERRDLTEVLVYTAPAGWSVPVSCSSLTPGNQ